ncbi:MAG: hypothetical protein BWX66_01747 [Deltaproteobacteria bacterium ADurb.Bin058]|nr:MAG: hypothetical protein BWX66_01747 [Deltaproteobacteria bacterium ADurb.Bin058]
MTAKFPCNIPGIWNNPRLAQAAARLEYQRRPAPSPCPTHRELGGIDKAPPPSSFPPACALLWGHGQGPYDTQDFEEVPQVS